ncbi:glycosyltransferase [Kosakonia sp. H02]|nr:glycosyltransferase [Kosakonia sp. H02]
MPRILITTNHLEKLQGSELVTLEAVQFFLEHGWDVGVFTHLIGGDVEQLFLQLEHQERLLLTNDDNYPFEGDYDIVWLQHNVMNAWLRSHIFEEGIRTRFIFNHMSSFADMELPVPGIPENEMAYRILAVSHECSDALKERGIDPDKIALLDNPVPDRYITAKAANPSSELKKALFISNHRPPELDEAVKLLTAEGVDCMLIGGNNKQVRVTPELISEYDLVITIGKSVQYSLVAGVPVYIYDLYGGDGYLTADNLEKSHYHNFSGRATNKKRSGDAICNEILSGYVDARSFVVNNRNEFASRWSLNNKLSALIDLEDEASFFQFSETAFREIDLHNKKFRKLVDPAWSYSKWFSSIQDGEKRLDAVEYILKENDALIPIDVIIYRQDEAIDIDVTLASIEEQKYKANKVWLLSGDVAGQQYVEAINGSEHSRFDANLNDIISVLNSSIVLFVHAGDMVFPHTLLAIAEAKALKPQAKAYYFDEEVFGGEGKTHPILKPDINIDLLRSYPYVGKMLAFDTATLIEESASVNTYGEFFAVSMFFKLIEQQGLAVIEHLQKICFRTNVSSLAWLTKDNSHHFKKLVGQHLTNLNVAAHIDTIFINNNSWLNIKYTGFETASASIIIIANNDVKALSGCVEKLLELTTGIPFEIIVVSYDDLLPEVKGYLQQLADLSISQIKVCSWQGSYSWPGMNNMAAYESSGDILVFLNPDMLIVEPDWLSTLAGYFTRPEVGLVGPKIINQDAQVVGAGLVLGMNGNTGRIFEGESTAAAGYLNRLQVANNMSALTHECLSIRKDVFVAISGFNADEFTTGFSEVDLALRLIQNGYCHVFVPSVRLVCLNIGFASSRQSDAGLQERFYEQWLPSLHSDPAYNRNLSRHSPGFELSPYLATVHHNLPGKPLPVVIANNVDRQGCGYYRIIHPFNALTNELFIDGGTSDLLLKLPDITEFKPDTILIQPGTRRGLAPYIERIKKFSNANIILDYDDYVPNIPVRSAVRRFIKQDIIKDIRKDCQLADRIVVSTPALAEEFFRFSDAIVVAPNGLPREIWGNLKSRRRVGQKIRVGWAGGATHTGDLSILKPLMKMFENDVQWVFMGMQPQGLDCEFHKGVPIEVYPEKLASLDLDLALVPLEINQFNVCKSNLRLLELGVCGIPIICTDIEPYRCGLPVTLVKNEFSAWVKAIKDHINNPDALSILGDKLRETINNNWMLEGALLETWRNAWVK